MLITTQVPLYTPRGIYNMAASKTHAGIVTAQSLADDTDALGSRTLPTAFFGVKGKMLQFYLCGYYSTDAAPGNGTITIKFGSTTFSTTGVFSLESAVTNKIWRLVGQITCRSTGATGTISGQTGFEHDDGGVQDIWHNIPMVVTSPVTVDLTAAQTFDIEWTATDAGTSLSCTCFTLREEF